MNLNLYLLYSSRKKWLTCLIILVSLTSFLICMDDIITSLTPKTSTSFQHLMIRFAISFTSIWPTVLCVILLDLTWMITISGWYSTMVGVMKWSNRLILVPLKLFKCALNSYIELLNRFLLTVCCYHVTYAFRSESTSIVAWISRKSLLKAGAISEV